MVEHVFGLSRGDLCREGDVRDVATLGLQPRDQPHLPVFGIMADRAVDVGKVERQVCLTHGIEDIEGMGEADRANLFSTSILPSPKRDRLPARV